MSNRSIIYVDGLNLYYGAVKNTRHKWLDLEKLFTRLRQGDDIQAIYYFTARIEGPHKKHQSAYLQALATLPKVNIILGKFKMKSVRCLVTSCSHPKKERLFGVPEEKRTDVSISVQMLDDAYQDEADRFVVVSGDSDLVPVLNRIKTRFPAKRIYVYVPARHKDRGAAFQLRGAADHDKTLPSQLIKYCQFPACVPDGLGGIIKKPADW